MANEPVFNHNPIIRRGVVRESQLLDKLCAILLQVVNEIPPSTEKQASNALFRARELVAGASLRAAAISGTLALRPESSRWSTILPSLSAIWRLQAQMVVDIGAVFGKNGKLTEESMIYCLFRHATAQCVRELVTNMDKSVLVRRRSLRVTENVLESIGTEIMQRLARRRSSRLLPLIGAVAVAAYAYYDTGRVGQTAIEFFAKEIELS